MRPRVFPAEDAVQRVTRGPHILRFNEAAGIPRGRHPEQSNETYPSLAASMRPRVFPAEDLDDRGYGMAERHASMRPRVFPAEDGLHAVRGCP